MKRKNKRILNSTGFHKCEICNEAHILQQHHINGRLVRNPHQPSNLANICSNCHTNVHHGLIMIEGRMMTSDGYKLLWHYKGEESLTGKDTNPFLY